MLCVNWGIVVSNMNKDLVLKYGAETPLHDLPDFEFETGGIVGETVKALGYIDGGRSTIDQNGCWNLTTSEFMEMMWSEFERQAL